MGARMPAWLLSIAFWLALARCDSPYPISATACDDWCLVTQRAGCEEDYPEGCVSECEERSLGRRFPRCEPEWLELTECYRAAPDAGFMCVDEESRPLPICIPERVALSGCVAPQRGQCIAVCLREALECAEPERLCEARCRQRQPGCQREEEALYSCQLDAPVSCVDPETLDPSEIPCLAEIGVLLGCAGFPPPPPAPP
jgi:hypothetical protein